MTVGQLLKNITSYEIEEWKIYFAILKEREGREELDRKAVQGLKDRQRTMRER